MVSRRRNKSMAELFAEGQHDYAAARASRFRRRRTGVSPTGSGADYHYRSESDYLRLIEQARDMDRNDCVVGQMIDRARDNTIQAGIQLDPQTGDKELDQALWDRWDDWSNDPEQCDVAGESTFHDIEELSFRHTLVDGDVLALPLDDGQLQMIEGHRVRTPSNTKKNVVNGVLLDDRRKRLEYWITRDDINPLAPLAKVSEIQAYPARDAEGHRQVFHCYNPKRFSQTRGVTALAPIFDCLGMFEDVNFAKLVQQQVVSCFAIFRQMDPTAAAIGSDGVRGEQTTETQADGRTRLIEGIAPGMEILGKPGETLQGFSPAVPNAEFFDHVRLILTLIGINLGLPLILVLLDASETNFSGWRGAFDQAKLGFKRNQQASIRRLHCPVYKWKVRQWLSEDAAMRAAAAKSDVDIFGHRWNCPTWPYIQPLQDAQAALLRVRNAQSSPRRVQAENGCEWETVANEIVEDNALAIRKAKKEAAEINKEFDDGQPVHWRELLSLPTPDGVTMQLAATDDKPEPKKAVA